MAKQISLPCGLLHDEKLIYIDEAWNVIAPALRANSHLSQKTAEASASIILHI